LDFGFSEEQEMLRDAAKRFLADNCSTKFVRQMMADATAHDPAVWQKLVGQGGPGLLIPEQYGGTNGAFLDMTVIVEEMGKALLPGPFFAAALLGAPAFIEGASEAQKKEFLPKMAEGKFIATAALAEAAGRRLDAAAVRDCFNCHATGAVRDNVLSLNTMTAGVQCERCHGPGERHVASSGQEHTIVNPAKLELAKVCAGHSNRAARA